MLRGNLCLVADVLFQSDFLNWRSAHVEASDKGPAKGPSPWGSLRTVTMSATWNFAESKQVRFHELRKLRELLFGREAIYPRSPETCRWRSKGKGTRSERVEKCSPSARTEERGRCDRRSRAHFGSKTPVPIRCNRWFVSLEHPRTRSVTLLLRNKDRHVRWSDQQRHQSLGS